MPYVPKTDWKYNDVLSEMDMNRIEGGIAEGKQLLDAHAADKSNPHGVTATQIGAETPDGAQAKVNTHVIDKNNPHGVTAAQVGAIEKGTSNTSVSKYTAVLQAVDTRSVALGYEGSGKLTTVTEKDGAITVKTTTLGYDGSGKLTAVTEVVGGVTVTTTLGYTGSQLTGITKAVV
ncbi:YD repeat-containing protein [Tumebacillus sp. BK434]|uniref:hypothetical protein n=1 Tax=Tumebacillus sp. BK434 TaxID=2512169 RepID=UPI0010453ED6|nr:hypothetical protein [Tumebacillus sp. BK434]TCP59354.1 YD repeat-containing protein [Tumebacillus sp. BK434]